MAIQDLTPQLRTRLRRVEKIVGFFVILAALVLLVGFGYYLYHTAQRKGWLIPKCPYFTFVQSAEGLKIGDPIVLMGFDVGNITTITAQSPAEHRVFVGMEVRQPYYGYIWSDSKVRIAAVGLLGGRNLEITAGEAGMPTVREVGGKISELWIHDHWVPIGKVHKGVRLDPDEQPSLSDRAQKLVATVGIAQHSWPDEPALHRVDQYRAAHGQREPDGYESYRHHREPPRPTRVTRRMARSQ
jgi:hypothetical protein